MLSFDALYHVVKVWGLLKELIFRQFFCEKIILHSGDKIWHWHTCIDEFTFILWYYSSRKSNVWKYEKKNLLDPKLQQNINQMDSMMFVWSVLHSVVEFWRYHKSWLEMFQQYNVFYALLLFSPKIHFKKLTPCRAWLFAKNYRA